VLSVHLRTLFAATGVFNDF